MSKPKCHKSSYAEKLKDPRWQRKRLEILNRDEWKCRDCGTETEQLQVHHCFYEKGDPWDTGSELLLTVCEPCHKTRQIIEGDFKRQFAELLSENSPQTINQATCFIHTAFDQGAEIAKHLNKDSEIAWNERAKGHFDALFEEAFRE